MRFSLALAGASLMTCVTALPIAATTGLFAQGPWPMRGVNLGGWFILEKFFNSDLFSGAFAGATDQWSFDSIPGAQDKLEQHWNTFITEDDFAKLSSWGINAVRIPIGYWAYQHVNGDPYISGADKYLERAIGWARTHNIAVLIDLHGSPGSQNGFDNSGHAGSHTWQESGNYQASLAVLKTIAQKYTAQQYHDVVFGIEIVNEPISWDGVDFGTTQQFARDAFAAIQSVSQNPAINVISHDSFQDPAKWKPVSDDLNRGLDGNSAKFWVDTHLYQNMDDADSKLDQGQHIQNACNYRYNKLQTNSPNLPVIVGEFSAATNICVNPDGSSVGGSTCTVSGCQCTANVPIEQWSQPLKDATTKYLEAQLSTYEGFARGWFIWTYKGPGGWGLDQLIKNGILAGSVTARKFPSQCGQTSW